MEPKKAIYSGIDTLAPARRPEKLEQFRPHVSLPAHMQKEDAMKGISIQVIVSLIGQILQMVSPEIRSLLKGFVLELEERASQTPNPWDNMLVGALKAILDVKENA